MQPEVVIDERLLPLLLSRNVPLTMSQKFSSHLPGLRRYARALTNSQRAGDALVLTTLEQLTRQASQCELPDRVQLYRALSRLWNGPVGWTNQRDRPGQPRVRRHDPPRDQ